MQNDLIKFDQDAGTFTLRENPWDTRALGLQTFELLEFNDKIGDGALARHLSETLNTSPIDLCMARIESGRKQIIRDLQVYASFLFVETSQMMEIRSLSKNLVIKERLTKKMPVRFAVATDMGAIIDIACTVFEHGRFSEDISIPLERTQERQRNWIVDMFNNQTPILVTTNKSNEVTAFMAYDEDEMHNINLLLGGAAKGDGISGVCLWHGMMKYFYENGVTSVRAMVSASNINVIALYEALGFQVVETLFGLHWHRSLLK